MYLTSEWPRNAKVDFPLIFQHNKKNNYYFCFTLGSTLKATQKAQHVLYCYFSSIQFNHHLALLNATIHFLKHLNVKSENVIKTANNVKRYWSCRAQLPTPGLLMSVDSKLQKWLWATGSRAPWVQMWGARICSCMCCAGRHPHGWSQLGLHGSYCPLQMQKAPASSCPLDLDCPVLYLHKHLTPAPFRFLLVSEPHCRCQIVCKHKQRKRVFLFSLLPSVAPSSYLGVYRSYLERIKLSLKCDALQEMIGLIIALPDKGLEEAAVSLPMVSGG